ncbi:hypothetical protein [Subtercola vilae]|uniref:Uncharacterized protein n=1 Tax=Subtercola vilae TaxID=2056433 RepID=A0A4T2B7G6_9MICO|nr:hypothetical protein [Subtercola vilae]TIH26032.1 hypothetical protein D4765_19080 [Subtercola vilae]
MSGRVFTDEAYEWLRGYHGSIDSTALLLAYEAGQANYFTDLVKRPASIVIDTGAWLSDADEHEHEFEDRCSCGLTYAEAQEGER